MCLEYLFRVKILLYRFTDEEFFFNRPNVVRRARKVRPFYWSNSPRQTGGSLVKGYRKIVRCGCAVGSEASCTSLTHLCPPSRHISPVAARNKRNCWTMLRKIFTLLPRAFWAFNVVGMLLGSHDGVASASFSLMKPAYALTFENTAMTIREDELMEPLSPPLAVDHVDEIALKQMHQQSLRATMPNVGGSAGKCDKCVYFTFPDEGPESALLADLLSRMAVRTLLMPFLRPATSVELIDLLTYSMYTTMLLVGSVIFGAGLFYLSWKVFLSIRKAASVEPVTVSFFCTIPGMRYLYSHIRHHLWGYPLQPRRRFASFVGASGSRKGLLEFEDTLLANHDPPVRHRRDSTLHHDLNSAANSAVSSSKRKSISKGASTRGHSKKSGNNLLVPDEVPNIHERRTRHSVSIHTPPASAPSSEVPSDAAESPQKMKQASWGEMCTNPQVHRPDHEPYSVTTEVLSPQPSNMRQPCIFEQLHETAEKGQADSMQPIGSYPASIDYSTDTAFNTNPDAFPSDLETITEFYSETTAISQNEDHLRPLTPLSTSSSVETDFISVALADELKRRRSDWVRNMPLFNNDYSFLPPEVKEVLPQVESKLSRRLTASTLDSGRLAGSSTSLEHSKLSRYFSRPRQSFSSNPCVPQTIDAPRQHSSWRRDDDPVHKKLLEADLTPPPGFGGRTSGYNRPDAATRRSFGAHQYSLLESVEDGNDPSASASREAFAFLRPRRSSTLAANSSYHGPKQEASFGHESRRSGRLRSEQFNNDWKWFRESDESIALYSQPASRDDSDFVFDPPQRPHSSNSSHPRSNPPPVGSGCRSAGHASPDAAASHHGHGHISLGIFDTLFSSSLAPTDCRQGPSSP